MEATSYQCTECSHKFRSDKAPSDTSCPRCGSGEWRVEYAAPAFKQTISLTTSSVGRRVRIELQVSVQPMQRVAPELTIDLQPLPAEAMELSITASVRCGTEYYGGQCIADVRNFSDTHPARAEIAELCEIWKRWHNGGLNAGTRAQRYALEDMTHETVGDYYTHACKHLESKGLFVDSETPRSSTASSRSRPPASRARRCPSSRPARCPRGEALLDHLAAEGWRLSDRKLKVAHATSPDGSIRLWFKAQAVYCSVALGLQNHTLQIANSLWSDIRTLTGAELLLRARSRAQQVAS